MQRAQLVERACLEPIARGLHITHWSSEDLARQAVADRIIPAISPATVRRILADVDLQPHRTRYWKTARLDGRFKGLSLRPEVVLANHQDRVFPTETATPGFAVFNVTGSYTMVRSHSLHMFSATLFNAGDRLYRNHLSFIKAFAPEIGRGVRVGYTIRFF